MLDFDNRFRRELPQDPEPKNFVRPVPGACWSAVQPSPVAAPQLLAVSPGLAQRLGLSEAELNSPEWLAALAGNALLPGMQPYATNYGGHQFGHWAGQLGDGRAIFLGEVCNQAGERWELQLKGAGPTPYARRADGRAVLRSSLREFLCSEAMHHLGIPTTRALSLVGSGESVLRDMLYDGHPRHEPGAIVCRVAPSFTRFGHFQLPAARGERQLLQQLVDFTIDRDFADLDLSACTGDARLATWFAEVCARTARLIAGWMQVGFVHGVMNTDNLSILGLTIDYGPYGWLEDFDPGWTPNTTDAEHRRYCYGNQPAIAAWNLERLAEALAPLLADPARLGEGLARYDDTFRSEMSRRCAGKFGLADWQAGDAELVNAAFALLEAAELDMTEWFRQLAKVAPEAPDVELFASAAYREGAWQEQRPALAAWLARYCARLQQEPRPAAQRVAAMNRHNPRYVLRNYLAQQAIERAEAGDLSLLHQLQRVLADPYTEQAGQTALAALRPEWARRKPGCSMLSCSS